MIRILMTAVFVFVSVVAESSQASALPTTKVAIPWKRALETLANNPTRFAVPADVNVDSNVHGVWNESMGISTWTYAITARDATAIGLHANAFHLPSGATLSVSGGGESNTYTAVDAPFGSLWTRPVPGDTAIITATMPAAARNEFMLHFVGLQAGYKSFGPHRANNHAYQQWSDENTKAASSCAVNYECETFPDGDKNSLATVVVVIENVSQCTGTLVNNVAGDRKPLIITAGHCRVSDASAGSVRVYWNETTPCGQPLGTYGDGPTQVGAIERAAPRAHGGTTDGWLFELSTPPVIGSRVYFAGFDASDSAVTGGVYGIHHADNGDQQFVQWSSPPTKLGLVWDLNFSPSVGSEGHGASGSALYDGSNRDIGILGGGNGECPVTHTQYTRLGVFWATGSTSDVAARFWLDPANSGTKVVDGLVGAPQVKVQLNPDTITQGVGTSATSVVWKATQANSCTASGDWSGSKSVDGGNESSGAKAAGSYTYTLTCVGDGGTATDTKTLTVNPPATPPAPAITISASPAAIANGQASTITWTSTNSTTCTAAGNWTGAQALSGTFNTGTLPGAGPGTTHTLTYSLSCTGSGGTDTEAATVTVTTPAPTDGGTSVTPASSGDGGGGTMAGQMIFLFGLLGLARRHRSVAHHFRKEAPPRPIYSPDICPRTSLKLLRKNAKPKKGELDERLADAVC